MDIHTVHKLKRRKSPLDSRFKIVQCCIVGVLNVDSNTIQIEPLFMKAYVR